MITVNRTGLPPEYFLCLPLDAAKAAALIRKHFSEAQIAELVWRLPWRCPDCHPPLEEENDVERSPS